MRVEVEKRNLSVSLRMPIQNIRTHTNVASSWKTCFADVCVCEYTTLRKYQ